MPTPTHFGYLGRCIESDDMIRLRRVYDDPPADDSRAFLVDRLWPRGVRKSRFDHDAWLKDVAPSTELRQWFHHDPTQWAEFRRRYRRELIGNQDKLAPLLEAALTGDLTLVYAARDQEHNHAIVLKEYLDELLAEGRAARR